MRSRIDIELPLCSLSTTLSNLSSGASPYLLTIHWGLRSDPPTCGALLRDHQFGDCDIRESGDGAPLAGSWSGRPLW